MQGTQIQTNKQVQKTMGWVTHRPQVSKSQLLVNTKTDAHKGRPLKIEGRRAMAKTSNWFNHNYQLHTKCRAPKIVLLNQTSRVDTDSTRAYYKRDLSDLLEVHTQSLKLNLVPRTQILGLFGPPKKRVIFRTFNKRQKCVFCVFPPITYQINYWCSTPVFYSLSSQLHVYQLCSDTFIGNKARDLSYLSFKI